MPTPYETAIGSWTRRSTFFWAATGATVGLSNLWQFPYLASQHGGGLFILLYLACLLLVTLPLMLTEAALGRQSRHGLVLALDGFVRQARLSRHWLWTGRLSILAAFLVLSFTAVIGAICLAYVFYGALGRFNGATELDAAHLLSGLVADGGTYRLFMGWHAFFLLLVIVVSAQGVVGGLERTFRSVVPGLFLLLAALLIYSVQKGDVLAAVNHLLTFQRDDLTWESLQVALFHAFFTLGLGMGVWVIFGAYMPVMTPLKRAVFGVVLMDTLFAIGAGLMIYSLVLSRAPGVGEQGFSLLFMALPLSVSDLPGSQFVLAAIFLVVVLVAWTTSLALLEPVVGWFQEWTGTPRPWSVAIVGALVWLAGLASLLSFNIWSEHTLIGGSVFRWLELVVSGLLIPLVSILIAILVGWKLSQPVAFGLIGQAPWLIRQIWFWVMRLVLPLVVAYIGIHYSLTSVRDLCGAEQEANLCRPINGAEAVAPSTVVQPPAPGGATEEAPDEGRGGDAPDEGAPGIDPASAGDAAVQQAGEVTELEAKRSGGPKADKDPQSEDEILYHSA